MLQIAVHCSIYGNKPIDIKSDDFKNTISDAVKDLVLRDWNEIVKINQYKKLNCGKREYYVEVKLWDE